MNSQTSRAVRLPRTALTEVEPCLFELRLDAPLPQVLYIEGFKIERFERLYKTDSFTVYGQAGHNQIMVCHA